MSEKNYLIEMEEMGIGSIEVIPYKDYHRIMMDWMEKNSCIELAIQFNVDMFNENWDGWASYSERNKQLISMLYEEFREFLNNGKENKPNLE